MYIWLNIERNLLFENPTMIYKRSFISQQSLSTCELDRLEAECSSFKGDQNPGSATHYHVTLGKLFNLWASVASPVR